MNDSLLTITFKVILSMVLSGIIGAEREVRNKGAGLRTHVLVGVGSALIVLTSYFIFDIYKDITIVDPTRIIANIVTGIGFLCAGTIIRGGTKHISGLTTAATLWVVSGIGIAVGAGFYSAAVIVSVAVFVVLTVVRTIEFKISDTFKDSH